MGFTEARDTEWQWHQLGNMQVCTSLQRDDHASTPPLSFLQAGCPSCHPSNSVKALKAVNNVLDRHWKLSVSFITQLSVVDWIKQANPDSRQLL